MLRKIEKGQRGRATLSSPSSCDSGNPVCGNYFEFRCCVSRYVCEHNLIVLIACIDMFSAIRKARNSRGSDDGCHHEAKRPLLDRCAAALASIHHNTIVTFDRINLHVTQALAQQEPPTPSFRPSLLPLASLSSSTSPSSDTASKQQSTSQQKSSSSSSAAPKNDQRTLISEIEIVGADGSLKDAAESVVTIRPNLVYSHQDIEDELHRIFNTGWFSTVKPVATDTRDGVKLTFHVTPNTELRGFAASGANVLPQSVIQDALSPLSGKTLNYNDLGNAIRKLNAWYEDRGVLGQIIDVEHSGSGVVEIKAAEAVVNRIDLKYIDKKTGEMRDEGRTQPQIITRYMNTRPGRVYSLKEAQSDISAVYATGLFDDVSIRPQPAEGSTVDAPRVNLVMEVKERKTGGLAAGGGISANGAAEGDLPGLIGTISYSQRNLFGLGQRLVASAELGQVDSTFRISHTDPWVKSDPYRTSRTISAENIKSSAVAIHGKAEDDLEGPANVFVSRMIGGVEYGRPLGTGWQGSLGLSWQRAKVVDEHNRKLEVDPLSGGRLTFSNKDVDIMSLGTIRLAYTAPSGDGELVTSMEQAVPLREDWLNFNRLSVRGEKTVPVGPLRMWLCGKGGAIFGDLPPYEAFPIGGTNSVRGYGEGGVGSGRRFLAGSAELHIPLVSPFEGTLFFDAGSDLDSGASVQGDPAGARNKPGKGYGYGAGVRIETPIGPLRLEYGMNDRWQRRFHLGIGSHG
jgi:outer membrane protein insertion porin family